MNRRLDKITETLIEISEKQKNEKISSSHPDISSPTYQKQHDDETNNSQLQMRKNEIKTMQNNTQTDQGRMKTNPQPVNRKIGSNGENLDKEENREDEGFRKGINKRYHEKHLRTTSISSSEDSNSESNTEKEEQEGNTGAMGYTSVLQESNNRIKNKSCRLKRENTGRRKEIWRYVGRLHNDIQNNDLISYMNKNEIKGDITCEELTLGSTKAFKIGIREEEAEKTDNENFWPKGVLIRTLSISMESKP
jgi:hypothetical protein